jgi:tRNA(fMet)-specific endonuclease VapC
MIAFDADVLSELLRASPSFVRRAAAIQADEHCLPVVVVEEILRGRLNEIRRAEAGKSRITLERAYALFQDTVAQVQHFRILSYTAAAELLYQEWRRQRLRIGTHDLRIAAICVAHSVTFISRNRRDFEAVPGLAVQFWD